MKTIAALILLVPLNASAVMIVEYWGSVSWVVNGATVGDRVSGSLTIDSLLAPPDRHPAPNTGNYIYNAQGCDPNCPPRVEGPSFVSDGSGVTGRSDDHVWAELGEWDSFGVEDTEYGAIDRTFTRVDLRSPLSFLSGPQIDQAFDVDLSAEGMGSLTISSLIAGASRFFGATLDRVRATLVAETMKSCRP